MLKAESKEGRGMTTALARISHQCEALGPGHRKGGALEPV